MASRARRLLRAAPAESTRLISKQTDRDLDGEPEFELCQRKASCQCKASHVLTVSPAADPLQGLLPDEQDAEVLE